MGVIIQNTRIFVIGTGVMGKGIVQILAQSELVTTIFWKGSSLERLENGLSDLKFHLNRMVNKGRISAEDATNYIAKIFLVENYSAAVDVKCIIEAISEDMNIKRDIFTQLGRVARKDTILASNTSSLSITELASLTQNPENVIGLHFFNPAPVMKLTEVVAGLTTSPETIAWAMNFAKKLGKDPVLVNEAPGFIVNRMLIPMINEAIGILAEGVASAEEIDKAMCLGANHPIGPLALADLIGNDVNLSIMETLHSQTGDPKYRAHPLLRKMVRANRLGRKTGQGFFSY